MPSPIFVIENELSRLGWIACLLDRSRPLRVVQHFPDFLESELLHEVGCFLTLHTAPLVAAHLGTGAPLANGAPLAIGLSADNGLPPKSGGVLNALRIAESTLGRVAATENDPEAVVSAYACGACAVITRKLAPEVIEQRIRAAIDRSKTEWRVRQEAVKTRASLARLTPAEREVLKLMSSGYHTKKIAGTLGRSPNTVRVQRASIMKKLDAETDTQIVNSVLRLDHYDLLKRSGPILSGYTSHGVGT